MPDPTEPMTAADEARAWLEYQIQSGAKYNAWNDAHPNDLDAPRHFNALIRLKPLPDGRVSVHEPGVEITPDRLRAFLVEHDEQRDRADKAEAEARRLRTELEALRGDDEDTEPSGGWVLWDAEGRWVSTTTSEAEDPWATNNVTEKERLALVTNGYFIDKLDPDGWRVLNALHGGANVAGIRDQWLAGKVELAKPGGMTPAELLAWRAAR